jgi:hypothetical protein
MGFAGFPETKVLERMNSSKSMLCIRIIESGVSKRPMHFFAFGRTKCAQDLFMSTSTFKGEDYNW